jgi:hypothetical protein
LPSQFIALLRRNIKGILADCAARNCRTTREIAGLLVLDLQETEVAPGKEIGQVPHRGAAIRKGDGTRATLLDVRD